MKEFITEKIPKPEIIKVNGRYVLDLGLGVYQDCDVNGEPESTPWSPILPLRRLKCKHEEEKRELLEEHKYLCWLESIEYFELTYGIKYNKKNRW